MSTKSSRAFERLMNQALREIGEHRRNRASAKRAAALLTMDRVDSVPVFDRGPRARGSRAGSGS